MPNFIFKQFTFCLNGKWAEKSAMNKQKKFMFNVLTSEIKDFILYF